MKGRKMMATALMLALSGAGHTLMAQQGYDYLTFQTAQAERSVALAKLKKITFGGGQLTAVTTTGDLSFELADMKKLYFTDLPSAIGRTAADADARVTYDRGAGCLRVEGNTSAVRLAVYTVDGMQRVSLVVSPGGGTVGVGSWPKGIYIVKTGGQTIKFSKR